jgi:hypothetical protein
MAIANCDFPVPASPAMQVCFPRAIRPSQSHSIFSGEISAHSVKPMRLLTYPQKMLSAVHVFYLDIGPAACGQRSLWLAKILPRMFL